MALDIHLEARDVGAPALARAALRKARYRFSNDVIRGQRLA
jgi:hypothetical protein